MKFANMVTAPKMIIPALEYWEYWGWGISFKVKEPATSIGEYWSGGITDCAIKSFIFHMHANVVNAFILWTELEVSGQALNKVKDSQNQHLVPSYQAGICSNIFKLSARSTPSLSSSSQCDQIGLLLESLRDKFYYKNQPKYWATICAILKTSLNA